MRWLRALGYYGYSLLEMVIHVRNWPALLPVFLRKSAPSKLHLKLRSPALELVVRSAMDIWSIKETFLDQFYTRYGVAVENGWTVVDIGAGIGDYCIYAAYGKPESVVFAFEPYADSFALLNQNLALNGIENVKAFNKAVWHRKGELFLSLATGEPLQISSHSSRDRSDSNEGIMVEAVSLASVISDANIDSIDLLKMDCEGAEYMILLNMPPETLARVERIIMEYHDLDQSHAHPVLVSFLEEMGYQVTLHANLVHKEIGYLFAQRG